MSRTPAKVTQADVARTIRAAIQAGVVVPWQWPDLMADATVRDLRAVQAIASKGRYRASPQKAQGANLIKVWLESGALKRVEEKDDKGMSRPFVIVEELGQ